MSSIYAPSDDSYFFSDFLNTYLSNLKNKEITYLDMGAATGILSEVAQKYLQKEKILAVDINSEAVDFVSKKGFKTKRSNLFLNIKEKFDLITFNAPYLPLDKKEPEDSKIITTGGKRGDEISLKFVKQAKKHLKKDGRIFLLISSFTPKNKLNKLKPKIAAKKKIFFEELLILEFQND